jgi:hypothetical protein
MFFGFVPKDKQRQKPARKQGRIPAKLLRPCLRAGFCLGLIRTKSA